ncbi:MAG TPA: hypothetical protein VFX43_08875, partial [Chitinophagaceae bacterium]|nr:hypothetical protein [Chitinophagaceae bacterium]
GIRIRTRYRMQNDLAGKTGTTNSNTDGWFIGYCPQLLAGAWVGFNYNFLHFNSTHIGQGANTGLPIFAVFMKKVYADPTLDISPDAKFDLPPAPEMPNPYNFDPGVPPGEEVPNTTNGTPNDYFDVGNSGGKKEQDKGESRKTTPHQDRKPKALYPPQVGH